MKQIRRILIIDDDADLLIATRMQLRGSYSVLTASSTAEGLAILAEQDVDLVLLDVGLEGENGLEGIRKIHDVHPSVGVAMLSGLKDTKTVVTAIRAGAVDYLTKPLNDDELVEVVEKAVAVRDAQERREALLCSQTSVSNGKACIVYRSKIMTKLMREADKLRGHDVNVLIVGKTGTGKELLARYINESEKGGRRPFVAVNCSAIPDHLLESELFGHEAGAFTGAIRRRIGKFEVADGGDILLDEVSTMKLDLQVKLLRVLQEKEFSRLGSNVPIKSNFRVIAASNQTLDDLMERGEFRADLYHRLRVVQLDIPPLSERVEDIPVLIEYFLENFSSGIRKKTITERAMARLMEHKWTGNVRELSNVIQSLIIMTHGDVIDESSFAPYTLNCNHSLDGVRLGEVDSCIRMPHASDSVSFLKDYIQHAEKSYIQRVIDLHEGDKSASAKKLGIGRTTLYMKLKEFGLM
ncbi:MAG: sigma-54 dependent transcriptional regulator [Pseudomonadota bacterium]